MRLIGTLKDENLSIAFSAFLSKKHIPHQIEISVNRDWGSSDYNTKNCLIWIHDEDDVKQASQWLTLLQENASDPIFHTAEERRNTISSSEQTNKQHFNENKNSNSSHRPTNKASLWERQPMGWVTRCLLILCCVLLFFSEYSSRNREIQSVPMNTKIYDSKLNQNLLYDYPLFFELINRYLTLYGQQAQQRETNEAIPQTQQEEELVLTINHTPFWPGIYALLLKHGFEGVKNGLQSLPVFEKISRGQVWRLVTPCVLHSDVFHLFFNMLWLIVLGKQMEQRLKKKRYIIFILLVGAFSNTAQYLMSGPNFIGFSGVLCGMLAFIWMRQKKAAWEGYLLDRTTISFMMLYIFGMAAIQLISFIYQKAFDESFSLNIANTAHIAGGIAGYVLAKLDAFKWRHD